MPRAYNASCIVLSKRKLGETDSIVALFSEDGRQIRAVAKGLRRPGNRIGARLEPYSIVNVLLHPGKSLDIVTEVRCVSTNEACRDELDKAAVCAAIAELVEKTSRDGALVGSNIYALTSTALSAIGQADPSRCALLGVAHLIKAMAMQGLRPSLRECVACGRPCDKPAYLDITAGGVLCSACLGEHGADRDAPAFAAWVDLVLRSTFEELDGVSDAPVCELLDFCDMWARAHLGVRLKSVAFLRTLI